MYGNAAESSRSEQLAFFAIGLDVKKRVIFVSWQHIEPVEQLRDERSPSLRIDRFFETHCSLTLSINSTHRKQVDTLISYPRMPS